MAKFASQLLSSRKVCKFQVENFEYMNQLVIIIKNGIGTNVRRQFPLRELPCGIQTNQIYDGRNQRKSENYKGNDFYDKGRTSVLLKTEFLVKYTDFT